MLNRTGTILALSTLLLTACADAPDSPDSEESPAAPEQTSLETATSLGVMNARMPFETVITSGQVTQEQFGALAESGVRNFISLRLATENGAGWEEAFAGEVSANFSRIPIGGSADLSRENVEALDRILDQVGDEPTALYCGSSNRVGALLALRAFWLDGMPANEAMELGRDAGMTRLESAVAALMGEGNSGS